MELSSSGKRSVALKLLPIVRFKVTYMGMKKGELSHRTWETIVVNFDKREKYKLKERPAL